MDRIRLKEQRYSFIVLHLNQSLFGKQKIVVLQTANLNVANCRLRLFQGHYVAANCMQERQYVYMYTSCLTELARRRASVTVILKNSISKSMK
jgi:hypothetical protein